MSDDAIRRLERRLGRMEDKIENLQRRNRRLEQIVRNELDIDVEKALGDDGNEDGGGESDEGIRPP